VLKSFCKAQQQGEMENIKLILGNKFKYVNLKVPLAFIIGDSQGGDNICGCSAYYNKDAHRISQMCDVTPCQYGNAAVDCCNLLVMKDIQELVLNQDNERLYDLMQSKHWQAFFNIDYGGEPGGVFTVACPPEALHAIENGIILHCLKQVFGKILTREPNSLLDNVVQAWRRLPKQKHMKGEMAEYPQLLFQDGLSTITRTSAETKVGIMFAIIIAALTHDGHQILLNA